MFDFAIPLQAPLGCRTNEQSFLRSKGVVDFHHGVIAGLTDTHMLFSNMHYPYRMDCQICLRGLERFEPVYRMQFGPEINNGWRTSVCSRCLSAFVESLKRPGLRDRFRSPKPCEVCARPVYNLKRWTVTRAICSPRCRGIIDTEPAKQRRSSRSFGFLA
jgi:hypothetical protein